MRPYRLHASIALVLAAVGQGILALIPLLQQIIVDRILGDSGRGIYGLILLLLGIGLISFGSHAVRRYLSGRVGVDVQHDLRVELHRHLHTLDLNTYRQLAAGDIISRSTSDLNLIQMFIAEVPLFVANVSLLVVGLVVMFALSPMLFLVVALFLPILGWATWVLRRELYPAAYSDQVLLGQVASAVDEEVQGVSLVRAYGQEPQRHALYTSRAARLFSARVRTAGITSRWTSIVAAIPNFTQVAVLGIGGWLAFREEVSLGVFIAFASYVVQFTAPIRLLGMIINTAQLARSGAKRTFSLQGTEPSFSHKGGPWAGIGACDGGRAGAGTGPGIELEDVTYRSGASTLIDRANLTIAPGQTVAVLGPSGSGKTTLGLLLSRHLDPSGGAVRIGGQDLAATELAAVRAEVVMVFDEVLLYSGSIRENLALGHSELTDTQIAQALRRAGAAGFVAALPDGLDTVMGADGMDLSGGQRQRLALARAYLADPEVLILDDVTSALDAQTERAVLQDLRAARAGKITILLTHRPGALALADQVVVLDAGHVRVSGTLAEVSGDPFVQALRARSLADEHRREATGNAEPGLHPGPDPRLWPEWSVDEEESQIYALIGLEATDTGVQLDEDDRELRAAVAKLPPLRRFPAAADNRIIPAADPRIFAWNGALRHLHWPLLLCAALVVLEALSNLSVPAIFRLGIDSGVVAGDTRFFVGVCVLLLVAVALGFSASWALLYRSAVLTERLLYALRRRLFTHLQRLPIDFFERNQPGSILTRLTTDVDSVTQLMSQGMVNAIGNIITCVGVLVALVLLDWRLAAVMLLTALPLAVAGTIYVRGSERAYRAARTQVAKVSSQLSEHIRRLQVTQSYGAQSQLNTIFATQSRRYRDARRRSMLYISVFFPFLNLLNVVAKALILAVGARLVGADLSSVGVVLAALLYVDLFFTPLQQLSMVLDLWIQARVAVRRMRQFLAAPEDEWLVAEGKAPLGNDVRLEEVGFSYRDAAGRVSATAALTDVTVTLAADSTTAVVGTTGAGKSTLMKLLLGFYAPDRGRISLGGVDITEIEDRHIIAYVSQDPFLFHGTVASNIAFGDAAASQAEIERAARAVGAHEAIAQLPQGYQTPVSSGRQNLSAGQQQLICLARAELVGPRLLVLDEATANLDPIAESAVFRGLENVALGRTTVVVAHRLATAARADAVAVLSQGRLVQFGTHEQLVDAPGRYRELWQAHEQSSLERVVPGAG